MFWLDRWVVQGEKGLDRFGYMKINELMKGDWIQHTTDEGGFVAGKVLDAEDSDYVRINALVTKGVKLVYPEFIGVDDDFEGIELTPDIMIKNGFKKNWPYWKHSMS